MTAMNVIDYNPWPQSSTVYCGDNCNHTGPHRYNTSGLVMMSPHVTWGLTDDGPLPHDADPQPDEAGDDPIPDEAGITPGEDDPEASEVDIPDLED